MSNAPVVRITSRSFGEASPDARDLLIQSGMRVVDAPRGPYAGVELVEQLAGARAAIVGTDGLDAEVLAELPDLRAIVKHGIGVDNIDLDAAREAGITVANVKGANAGAVGDYVVGAMIVVVRQVCAARASLERGEWRRFVGEELGAMTVGLLGFGRTGRAVADRLTGFRPRLIVFDPVLDDEGAARAGVELASFEKVLRESDVLSLHLPLDTTTRHTIDAAALARMKRGAVLVNAARAGLVDQRALVDALDAGTLSGAAIDVFDPEPPPADHLLLGRSDVLCTPHLAAYTFEALRTTSLSAARHVIDILAGTPCREALVGALEDGS